MRKIVLEVFNLRRFKSKDVRDYDVRLGRSETNKAETLGNLIPVYQALTDLEGLFK